VDVPGDIHVCGDLFLIDEGIQLADFIELCGESVLNGSITLPLDAHYVRFFMFNDSSLSVSGCISCINTSTVTQQDLLERNRIALEGISDRLQQYEEELIQFIVFIVLKRLFNTNQESHHLANSS
jgi:hypothetical protein